MDPAFCLQFCCPAFLDRETGFATCLLKAVKFIYNGIKYLKRLHFEMAFRMEKLPGSSGFLFKGEQRKP